MLSSESLPYQPLRVFGRQTELDQLRASFRQACQSRYGEPRLVLVHGVSGSGKTSLVEAFAKTIASDPATADVVFVRGKSGQFQSRPFQAISEALEALGQHLHLAEQAAIQLNDVERLDQLCSLRKILANEGRLLMRLIPTLTIWSRQQDSHEKSAENGHAEKDIQTQDSEPLDTGQSATARMTLALLSLLRGICMLEPVCIFIDDVQWTDQASRQILTNLVKDESCPNLMLLLAYRDDPNLDAFVCGLSKRRCLDIVVENLPQDALQDWMVALLHQPPESTLPLVKAIHAQTNGNPFFSLKYLELLKRRGVLRFHEDDGKWRWSEDDVLEDDNAGSVVDIVKLQISLIPKAAQKLLQVTACMGFSCNRTILESLVASGKVLVDGDSAIDDYEKAAESFSRVLGKCVEEKLVESVKMDEEELIRFVHDRVQQAAYELIGNREGLHLQIGRSLIGMKGNPYIMDAADQCNRGSSRLESDEEKILVINLNVEAGILAQRQGSFTVGAEYLLRAKELALDRFWRLSYPLMVKLYTQLIQSEYSKGMFEESNKHVEEVLLHAKTLDDAMPARFVRMQIYGAQRRFGVALEEARMLLNKLGEKLPRSTTLNVMVEYFRTKRLAGKKSDDELLHLPPIPEERIRWVVRILKVSFVYGWNDDQNYAGLALFRLMRVTLRHGSCETTPFAFVGYGSMISAMGDESEGFRFARLATSMVQVSDPPTILLTHANLFHLRRPATQSLDPLLDGYRAGLRFGDTYFGALCIGAYPLLYILCGLPMIPFIQDMRKFGQELRLCGQLHCLDYILPMLQLALNLSGQSKDPYTLTWESCKNEEIFADNVIADDSAAPSVYLHYAHAFNNYILGDTEGALLACQRANFRLLSGTHFSNPFHAFIDGLVYMAVYRRDRHRQHLKIANQVIQKLEKLARRQEVNCLGMLLLLRAEKNALDADLGLGKKAYDTAIANFARGGFVHFAAIAYERAGEFALQRGDVFWAKHYLSHAAAGYDEWGAILKATHLRRTYPFAATVLQRPDQPIVMSLRGKEQFDAAKDSQLEQGSDEMRASLQRPSDEFRLPSILSLHKPEA